MSDAPKIRFRCPHCGKSVSVANEHAGKRAKCPGCKQVLAIPTLSDPATSPSSRASTTRRSEHSAPHETQIPDTPAPSVVRQPEPETSDEITNQVTEAVFCGVETNVRKHLSEGDRLRAIGECRVRLNCGFDAAHGIVCLIEASPDSTDEIQTAIRNAAREQQIASGQESAERAPLHSALSQTASAGPPPSSSGQAAAADVQGAAAVRSAARIPTVVFRPLQSITWPHHCVGCFAVNPTEKLRLDVFPATKTSTGTKAGGVAGAFVGALVGGIAGGIASAAVGETTEYRIPICRRCLANLPQSERKALASHEFRMITASPRVNTQLLSREFKNWRVVLTFANKDYAQAFRSANPGLTYDTVEASKSPKPSKAANTQETIAAKPKEPTKTKCQGCGEEVLGSDWVCPHCGRTEWGGIGCVSVVSIAFAAIGVFVCNPGFWRWLWIVIGGLLFLLPLSETIKSLKWSKKRNQKS